MSALSSSLDGIQFHACGDTARTLARPEGDPGREAVVEVIRAAATALRDFPYIWRLRVKLGDRYGQPCRVNARGALNSIEVEFLDGFKVITSRFAVRKRRTA